MSVSMKVTTPTGEVLVLRLEKQQARRADRDGWWPPETRWVTDWKPEGELHHDTAGSA